MNKKDLDALTDDLEAKREKFEKLKTIRDSDAKNLGLVSWQELHKAKADFHEAGRAFVVELVRNLKDSRKN